MTETRTQHCIGRDGEKKSFKVKSIKSRFKKGKGGALMGAASQPAPATKVIGQAAKVEPPAK